MYGKSINAKQLHDFGNPRAAGECQKKNVAQQVNTQLLTTYWNIGRIIVEYEQQNQIRADYGKQTLRELSKELTREFGKGFFSF